MHLQLNRPWAVLALLLTALGLNGVANATRVMAVPLKQMTEESQVVVHARVGQQQVRWDENHSRILTLTTIEVIDSVKGAQKGDVLTIYQVGGTLDGITYKIPGALNFVPGEEMIFFAVRFQDMIVSYGMGLGKYHVSDDAGGKTVKPEYGDVSFMQRGPDGEFISATRPDPLPLGLSVFVRNLKAMAKGGAR